MTTTEDTVKLTRNELKTLFYIGRKLRLIDCLIGPCSKVRTVKAQKSYGYEMLTDEGKTSFLRFDKGDYVVAESFACGYSKVMIFNSDGTLAAKYEVL